jgi:hypothetical protein
VDEPLADGSADEPLVDEYIRHLAEVVHRLLEFGEVAVGLLSPVLAAQVSVITQTGIRYSQLYNILGVTK